MARHVFFGTAGLLGALGEPLCLDERCWSLGTAVSIREGAPATEVHATRKGAPTTEEHTTREQERSTQHAVRSTTHDAESTATQPNSTVCNGISNM